MFEVGRPLKPFVKARQAVAFETVKECKIYVHVIKGENVPVRHEYVVDFSNSLHKSKVNEAQANVVNRLRRATPNIPSDMRVQLQMIQEEDQEGDLEQVPPTVIVKDRKDLINTA